MASLIALTPCSHPIPSQSGTMSNPFAVQDSDAVGDSEALDANAGNMCSSIHQLQEQLLKTEAELERLKMENTHLEDVNRRLLHQLALRNERLAYFTCHIDRLPHEIFLIILRSALPSAWVLRGDTSLPPFPQSIWSVDLRMKLSIAGVSKLWHQIGSELLYESVTLRRIGQLPAFVRALEERNGLGALVRNIDISCFVPHGYAALHDQETARIFELCPRLSHFGFKPPFQIPASLTVLPRVSDTITSLEYNNQVEYSLILPTLVELSASLRSLALSLPITYDATGPKIFFEKLEALRVRLSADSMASPPQWTMPALRRLWLQGSHGLSRIQNVRDAEAFLNICGRTLAFLWLPHFLVARTEPPVHIQSLLDRCPALKHLAMPRILCEVEPPLTHQRIHLLDLLCFPTRDTFTPFLHGFPALRALRTLDQTLTFPWDVIPPDLPCDGDAQLESDEEDGTPEAAWITAVLATDPDADDSDDSDYVFNSQAGSNTDSESDSEVSEEGRALLAGEFYLDEDWEVDRAEALAIFRGS
ncbi:hypothetical protein FB451DRAFT_1554624, partial [Mycena latifolia]